MARGCGMRSAHFVDRRSVKRRVRVPSVSFSSKSYLDCVAATKQPILRPQHWNTPFSGENKTETNALWKGLFPAGAGLVHIPRSYAAELQLPQSVPYKGNASERVYFVAAYHNIHCLVSTLPALTSSR